MRRFLPLLLCFLYCGCVLSANAQIARIQARDAEWKAYQLPQISFARHVSANKEFLFRIPADWKQEDTELIFTGPHASKITVMVQEVPDGYPLQDYFASVLRSVRDAPGAMEATVVRKTQLQDLEAREILLEISNLEGEMIRSTTWITVSGPLAVSFNLQTPITHTAEIEPVFKAVVQSVIFLSFEYPSFDQARSAAFKTPAPGPINELESIVASLIGTNSDRASAVARLAALFSSIPDVAIDLLLDRRPLVRTAAVQALVRSNNQSLTPFLWELIDDREPLVAEPAARTVARMPDVVEKLLQTSIAGFNTETIARVWPFMGKEKRIELLQKLFSETAVPRPISPPPPVKSEPKHDVTVAVIETIPVQPGKPARRPQAAAMSIAQDPSVQIGALTLLTAVSPDEFKLPLARIMASNYDPLIAVGLQVANGRAEPLPVDALLKLVLSADQQVSKFAAQSLGWSANISDVPRLEALIAKHEKNASRKELIDELKLTLRKIHFRNELRAAKDAAQSRELISKSLSDPSLAEFVWRFDCAATAAGCGPAGAHVDLKRDLNIKPFGENLFPKKVRHYLAIPNPGQAIQNFYDTLQSMQMDSPRAQSTLVLMMGGSRSLLSQQLSAPADAARLIDYTGIDPDSPIAMSAWAAEGARDSTSAQRRAIVLRLKDRERFERLIERIQHSTGSFANLIDYVAIGARSIAAWPAILPLSVQAALDIEPPKPSIYRRLRYGFVNDTEWNGLQLKSIEHRGINSSGEFESATTYIVYLGDTAILAPDIPTVRELLSNNPDRQFLADNDEYRRTIDSRGDAVYFSDLKAVAAEPGDTNNDSISKINESGALRFSNSTWENTHHFVFDESDWAEPLHSFHPKELEAPRSLLPASTIAYYLMKLDLASAWSKSSKEVFLSGEAEMIAGVWSVDFQKDVLPELGPECGAILLELPNVENFEGGTWAIFCKLKSNKLSEALTAGKLFRGVGPTADIAEFKIDEASYFAAARNGFLVVSNQSKGLAVFDGKTNLAATRDYSRAVAKVPEGVVAFGGYNLEAAVAAAKVPVDGFKAQVAGLIFSVANAFHSQNFYAKATAGSIEARSSVAMDREGRYPVADLTFLPRGTNITFTTIEPSGVPITDQSRVSTLVLRVRGQAPGAIDNIKDDIKTANQIVEQKSPTELLLTVAARRAGVEKSIELPVKDPELAPYLKANDKSMAGKQVEDQAREIAGDDRDAWSVARKLADWTHQNLEWKQVATADPAQTLATREADCSEFSELFVAMARSLGLPARLVSGLAYNGTSFGGHAWVEVWVGRWIELDPTWGTAFVDATHIRNESNTLLTSSALNLIELEVLETKRTVPEFQRSAKALAEHLVKAILSGVKSEIEAAMHPGPLTDEFMGAGAWAKLNDGEREQMWSAYRRVLKEILSYGKDSWQSEMRLLHLEEKDDVAEATCLLTFGGLIKLKFSRHNDVWYLVEMLQSEAGLYLASEMLRPTIKAIEQGRAGQKAVGIGPTDYVRGLLLIQTDVSKALALADRALAAEPSNQLLRLLKAGALMQLERKEEALKLLQELSDESFAPAIFKLAYQLRWSEDEKENRQAIDLYTRYAQIEPRDPRPYTTLGSLYDKAGNSVQAEAAYRKAIQLDPGDIGGYIRLMEFLILKDRIAEVQPVLLESEKYKDADADVFAAVLESFYMTEEVQPVEKFAASDPARMKTSFRANLALGRIYVNHERYVEALRLFRTAAELDNKSATPYIEMAILHREQSRWRTALSAAQQAIKLEPEYSEGYYQRACALARLGRLKEAMSSLEKAVELDAEQVEYIADEEDLKPLSRLPAFKKLLPEQ